MSSLLPPRVRAFSDFVQNDDLAAGQEFHAWPGSTTNALNHHKKSASTSYYYHGSSEENTTYHQHLDCWSDMHEYSHPSSHKNDQRYPAIYPVDRGSSYTPSGLLNRANETSHYPRKSWSGRNSTDENNPYQQDTGCYYYYPEDENTPQNHSSYHADSAAIKYNASSNPEPKNPIQSCHQEGPAARDDSRPNRKTLNHTMGLNTVTISNRPARNHEYSNTMQPKRTHPNSAAAVIPGKFKKIIDNTPAAGDESESSLRPLDIVCGRGAPTNFHYGNQAFRDLVEEYQTKYLCAKRSDKPTIAMEVLETIKARGGRFVRRQKAGGGGHFAWEPIHDKSAYEKVCQWLRDGAPDLQRRVLSSISVRSAQR